MRRRTRRRLFMLLFVLVVGLAYRLFGPRVHELAGLSRPPTIAKPSDHLRLGTWNLANFPRDEQDLAWMQTAIASLDVDVLAVQEVHDDRALRSIAPAHRLLLSRGGGRGRQRLGLLVDPEVIEVVGELEEYQALSLGGRLRPAAHAYLRVRPSGPDFHVVIVHLKAKPDGIDDRHQQWALLGDWLDGLRTRGPLADRDIVVLGDFNTTGSPGGDALEELQALAEQLAPVGLRRIPVQDDCSAYWDGSRRDAWQEPSLLDHIFVAELAEAVPAVPLATPLHHCAKHRCRAFRSTEAYPEPTYAHGSDHCPVVLDIAAGRDDDLPSH